MIASSRYVAKMIESTSSFDWNVDFETLAGDLDKVIQNTCEKVPTYFLSSNLSSSESSTLPRIWIIAMPQS
jgi:hypothetical protein